DDGDDEEGSSEDDEDNDMDIKADKEEEEHPAPADFVVYLCQLGLIQRLLDCWLCLVHHHHHYLLGLHHRLRFFFHHYPQYYYHLHLSSTSSPPLQLPSASRKEDRPEVTLPPRKRLGITLAPGYKVGESSSAAAARPAGGLREDYGFVATMDREIMRNPEREVGYGITDSWDEIVET
nr:hypothetical protein [Tanacetum cinerariifolium]